MVELSIIEKALEDCESLVILGDFNENMNDDRKCTNIRNIINTFGLNQLIDTPTRITDTTTTLIDLILGKNDLTSVNKGTIEPFCSDHHTVYFSTSFMVTKRQCYNVEFGNMMKVIIIYLQLSLYIGGNNR